MKTVLEFWSESEKEQLNGSIVRAFARAKKRLKILCFNVHTTSSFKNKGES
jgi:hypothetical protein